MSRVFLFTSLAIVTAVGVMLAGCSNQQPTAQPAAAQDQPAADHNEQQAGAHSGNDAANHAEHADHSGQGQYAEALAKLSPEDRALAEKQQVCPVSGEPLGSMGTPYKVTVEGRDVLLCCPGCEAKIKADPEKYLTKLAK